MGFFRACSTSAFGKRRIYCANLVAVMAVTLIFASSAAMSGAATIALDLTCSLNGLSSGGSCSAGPSFGTITLEDLTGADTGKVKVTVDLGFPNTQKFRDLMLNYTGSATTITDSDPNNTVVHNNNSYSISPFGGKFDLGGTGGQGWRDGPRAGAYSTVLSGNLPLSTSDFTAFDSLGKLYAAIHIQNIGSATQGNCDGSGSPAVCAPGVNGPGSLKIGAPSIKIVPVSVPEPSTFGLIWLLAAFLSFAKRTR
jgi:hypothetical protein